VKRRLALKICRDLDRTFIPDVRRRRSTIREARRIGRKYILDDRFPYVESDDEAMKAFNWVMCGLADALLSPEDADKFKLDMWNQIEQGSSNGRRKAGGSVQ
jgi:hypothetical protein